ncbi:MAG TPA: SNF2-related protein [Candidatus Brocadiia bacterium]|nr:SNF2-related protein [Candidatus Brocadiia bacterium]
MAKFGERFEWLQVPDWQDNKPEKRASAKDYSTKKCPRCGWLDSIIADECFRCGYDYTTRTFAEDSLRSDGHEFPDVEFCYEADFDKLIASRQKATVTDWKLRCRAEELSLVRGFDTLISLNDIDIDQYSYQLEAARTALNKMRGQVILGDEVGLGKTIEAGIIIKELALRGLARRILILTPASLVSQWREELLHKFGERFIEGRRAEHFKEQHVVASIDSAKRSGNSEAALERPWDMLVIDEAHHLKNRRTQAYRFVNRIRKKYALFLTATPVHNELTELYSLITLVKPGLLGTIRGFKRQFVDPMDPRKPANEGHLKKMLGEVMIRNRRGSVGITLPARRAAIYHLAFSPMERQLYEGVSEYVRTEFRKLRQDKKARLSLVTLQKEICSSPQAAEETLRKLSRHSDYPQEVRNRLFMFAETCRAIPVPRKTAATVEIVERFPGRLIIYTDFLGTLRHLAEHLRGRRANVIEFHGGLSMSQRREAVETFRGDASAVLVSTQAGGEGLNFQFCRQVLNYDLPWNPMRLEQRIGRIHRIGQTQEVNVFNLAVEDTIENRIIELLATKIKMFETIIGELDLILGAMELESTFEQLVTDIWLASESTAVAEKRFQELGERIVKARERFAKLKENEKTLSNLMDV